MENLGRNITFDIYNEDGTSFHNLVIHNASYDSVVMSLGDKITGDVYYKDNTLLVTMKEYIVYKGIKYVLVNPPTTVKEGLVSDNSQLKGMTKYSFEFYHPMYALSNFPFTDVAVTNDEKIYLSQNKTFSWVGNLEGFIDKLNANLKNTEWVVQYRTSPSIASKAQKISDVLTFDKNTIADALKTAYETWEIPFVVNSYEGDLPSNYTRLEWVKIEELHQVVSGEESPFWLFIDNLASVSTDDKIYYCKVYNGKNLVHHMIPCLNANGNVGLYDDVIDTFFGSNQEITFTAGNKIGQGKRFEVIFGMPNERIYDDEGNEFVFKFGKGLGLKNNSRTPRKNKIVTRIVGYGSERNVPFGYPQIVWADQQHQDWDYTINNDPNAYNSYPIYDGIVGGQLVRLIKHPFTRTTLMPSIYSDTVNKKVNPLASGYNPEIEIKDYYDAPASYPNPINPQAPSFEIHEFGDIKPELGNESIISAFPYNEESQKTETVFNSVESFLLTLATSITNASNENEKAAMTRLYNAISGSARAYTDSNNGGSYTFDCKVTNKDGIMYVKYTSDHFNIDTSVLYDPSNARWIDDMDDDGNYIQSYFKITLPQLSFDLYASAAITEEMQINMRSGDCIGCTFPVQVDWDDYKKNFYDANGNFDPVIGEGHPRNGNKYPDSSQGQITVIVQKDLNTFGTLMPDIYRQPHSGDKFVILGISLPLSYISNAETRLDDAMKEYMLENNVYYYDYPLKFDEHFLATHTDILSQIKNNTRISFQYAGVQMALFVKQITIKYGEDVLPKYDITLTDDIEIVLNQIGQVTDDVSRMRVQVSELQKYYSENLIQEINAKLSKIQDDVCQGMITFQQGLNAIGNVIFSDEIRSPQFQTGLYEGRGWRIDNLGNSEFESLRVRSYLEVVELLVNRMQAQEGDTLFSDNDQIDRLDRVESGGTVYYILSLKEKYEGYVTSQMYGNIVKGIINTLAAKQAGVSNVEDTQQTEHDGENSYFTSWMRVVGTHNTDQNLSVNQIRVILYSDNETPSGKNFVPCELMTIARWGCYLSPDEQGISSSEKLSRERRQRTFAISVTDGRVVKYTKVNSPKLENWNYGVTIGELPQFVKDYTDVRKVLNEVGEHTDWLYAQGVVVGKFIKVDINGKPESAIVDCGEWVNGSTGTPSVRNGIYFNETWNEVSQQYETHDVWHNGEMWRCLINQPVTIGGVSTYYEPTEANHIYWKKMISGGQNASFYRLQASTASVNVDSEGNCTPSTLTIKVMHTEGGITTECMTMPENKGIEVYFDGVLEYFFNDVSDPNNLFNLFRNGFSSSDFSSVNTMEWVLRARSSTDVYDRVSIVATRDGGGAKYISITGACSDGTTQQSFSLSINDGATTTTYTTGSSVVKPDTVTGVYRGIALARVNRSTLALYGDIQIYDTYGGSVSQGISRADALAQAINSTSTDYFVILMTRDACGFTSSNSSLENAIKNCGGTKIQDTTRTRKAFAFIGVNGLAQNYALQMQGAYQVGLGAKLIAYVADGMFTTARTGEDGQKGDTGKIGRFFYYAQEWVNLSTVSYLVSDAQAPYFGYTNPQTNAHNYWVFNPENNGNYTMAQMGEPSSSNPNWQIMTSDFKYLITQAMFTDFAKLGSAVFSGDWMISQYGTPSRNITQEERNVVYLCVKVDGQYPVSTLATILDNDNLLDEYKDYGYTDDELEMLADVCQWAVSVMPNNTDDDRYNVIQNLSNSSYQFFGINSSDKFSVFSPNFAIDYLTGKSYQNDGTFRGIVTANLSYSPTGTKTGNDNVTLNPSSDKCGTFLISGITTVKNIYLPLASQYDGLEYNLIQAVYVNDEYKNCNINRSGSEQIYVPTNNKLTAVTAFTLPPNIIVKLKAISGSWYVVQGLT